MPGDGERPESGEKRDSFNEDAVRSELRKIVEREEVRLMEKWTADVNDVRSQYDAMQDVDEDAKRKLFSELDAGKAECRRRFQMMLDFIGRG